MIEFKLNIFQLFLLIGIGIAILIFVLFTKISNKYKNPVLYLGLFIMGCLLEQANYSLIPLIQSKISFVIPSIPVLMFLPAFFLFFVESTLVTSFNINQYRKLFLIPGILSIFYQLVSWLYVLNLEKPDAIHAFITGRGGHFTIQAAAIIFSVICLVRVVKLIIQADDAVPAYRFFKFAIVGIMVMLLHWVVLFFVDLLAPNSYNYKLQYFFWTFDILFLLYLGYKIVTIPNTLKANISGFKTPEDSILQSYANELEQLLIEKKLYLNPDLTRKDLADEMGLTEVYISSVIKNGLQTSYYQLINRHRLQEAIALIQIGKHHQITIEGLAKEAGFKSKSTFNKTFKEYTGKTPLTYISQN